MGIEKQNCEHGIHPKAGCPKCNEKFMSMMATPEDYRQEELRLLRHRIASLEKQCADAWKAEQAANTEKLAALAALTDAKASIEGLKEEIARMKLTHNPRFCDWDRY